MHIMQTGYNVNTNNGSKKSQEEKKYTLLSLQGIKLYTKDVLLLKES